MAKFTVNNVEFEYDLLDAEKAELYETTITKVNKELIKPVKNETLSKKIKRIGSVVCSAIDTLFGNGKSQELFGDKINLADISLTYSDILTKLAKINAEETTQVVGKITQKLDIKVSK